MAYTDERRLVTSQLYFPDAISKAVYRTEPYAARGPHRVTNDDDGIFPGDAVGSSLIGHVTEHGEGYMVSLTVGVTPSPSRLATSVPRNGDSPATRSHQ